MVCGNRAMIRQLSDLSTARELRLLAKDIDDEKDTSFVFCVIRGDDLKSAHRAGKPFELLGLIDHRKQLILDEIE